MSVRRRGIALSAAFLGLVSLLIGHGPAHAQQPRAFPFQQPKVGDHSTSDRWSLTPEQFRSALGQGSPIDPIVRQKLREALQQKFPDWTPEQIEGWAKLLESNPEFAKQLQQGMAAKAKDNGGPPPKLPPDFEKMLKDPPNGLKQPPPPPNPDATPARPNDLRPPLPDGPPPDGKFPAPKPADLNQGPQVEPPKALDAPGFNPPGAPKAQTDKYGAPLKTPEQTAKEKTVEVLANTWDKNIGPIDETPQVKRALMELVEGTSDMQGPQGGGFWDSLTKDTGDGGSSFADFFDGLSGSGGGDWNWPSFDVPSMNWGKSAPDSDFAAGGSGGSSSGGNWFSRIFSRPRTPSAPGSGGSGFGGFGIPALKGSWLPVVILAALLIGALVVWRFWYLRDPRRDVPTYELGGLGPWPVDPRRIATRQELVLAFEYLSVLICGPAAKTWTHHTIAEALADLATTHAEAAMILARLYELARYAPLDEPLTAAEIAEARRLVCRLAGVSYE